MLLMAAGGLLVVLVCVDMGIKQYIEENFEEEEERETILDKVVLRKVYNKGFCFNTLDKKPELVRKTSGILCACLLYTSVFFFGKTPAASFGYLKVMFGFGGGDVVGIMGRYLFLGNVFVLVVAFRCV